MHGVGNEIFFGWVPGKGLMHNYWDCWVCGRLGKSNSPPNRGIKKFRYAHSVWGRRRKKSNNI